MTRTLWKISKFGFAPAVFLVAALLSAGRALALDRDGYSIEILVGGAPLSEFAARGTSYVEALKNRDYAVRLRNRTGERVAIALSVDGLNSIDARTTSAADARKWILGPYETITLDGWQTSTTTARRFLFTTEERSYGAWLGRTQNLGLIAAAVFREKRPPVILYEERQRDDLPRSESKDSAGSTAPPESAAPQSSPERAAPGGLAATGIGQETSHPVRQVLFDAEDSPSTVLEIRYEYREALVRLGVFPPDNRSTDPLTRRESARGFQEPGFAPDPYRHRDR